jgi:hypothetical protein
MPRVVSFAAGASGPTSPLALPEASGDLARRHRRAGLRVGPHGRGHREGLRPRLAAVGNRHGPGSGAGLGVQGWDLPQEVLHRDVPLLRGPRLHGPARRPIPARRGRTAAAPNPRTHHRRVRDRLLDATTAPPASQPDIDRRARVLHRSTTHTTTGAGQARPLRR